MARLSSLKSSGSPGRRYDSSEARLANDQQVL
jgi:hypothetical protein